MSGIAAATERYNRNLLREVIDAANDSLAEDL
jgi:hypothetical protein